MLNKLGGRKSLRSVLKPFPKLCLPVWTVDMDVIKFFRDMYYNVHLSSQPQLIYAAVYESNLILRVFQLWLLMDY